MFIYQGRKHFGFEFRVEFCVAKKVKDDKISNMGRAYLMRRCRGLSESIKCKPNDKYKLKMLLENHSCYRPRFSTDTDCDRRRQLVTR